MDPGSFLRAFATVFLAELPDKTMVASIVLVARYRRPAAVWAGASAAFTVHVAAAVLAGRLLTLLPRSLVEAVVAGLFGVGAVVLLRGALAARRRGAGTEEPPPSTARGALLGSFALVVTAEWGDLTQLSTASLAAGTASPLSVAAGALLALTSVAALAVTAGRQLLARLPLQVVRLVAAAVFAALAVAALVRLLA